MNRFSVSTSFIVAFTLILALSLLLLAASCTREEATTDRTGVIVTILPQAEFVENVGKEKVIVMVMVPPGASPHTYEPTPGQMKDLARARTYAKVGSGIDFELVWMDKLMAANKRILVVDCSNGVQLNKMVYDHNNEDTQHDGDHHDDGMDPHIWMSPVNAKIMVRNICDGLLQVDPAGKAYYEANRDTYFQKLTEIDQKIRDGLSGVTNRKFMVFHPAFGYFARDYDLTMIPIEKEGKEPTAEGIARLIEQAKENNIKVVFASPQVNSESAKVIAREIGGKVIFIDSLARNYIENLAALYRELVQAMR